MRTTLLFIALYVSGVILFHESFSTAFFQDDFFLLKISNVSTLRDVLYFFVPRSDIQFYRPLSHELWYFTLRKLFGIQPVVWHVAGWVLWGTMMVLVYMIGKKILRQKALQYLLPILYGLSSIHYSTLFWSINTSYLMVSVFFFSGILVWWSGNTVLKKTACLCMVFILGLLANELMMTLLPILCLDGLLRQRLGIADTARRVFPLGMIAGIYTLIRFVYPPDIGSYPFDAAAIPSSYRWFIFFFLNWPEGIKDNMLIFWKIRPDFFHYFSMQVTTWTMSSAVVAASFIFSFFIVSFRVRKRHQLMLSLMFVSLWYIISILPIVLIPSHISPHHGSIALVGFLLFLLLPVDLIWKKIPGKWRYSGIYIVLVLWLLSARTTVMFNNETYWIIRRSDIAISWQAWVKKMYPHPANDSIIMIPTKEKEVRVALNEGEAIRQWYDNASIQVRFFPIHAD